MNKIRLIAVCSLAFLTMPSCGKKRKCYSLGNGDTFNLMLYRQDETQLSIAEVKSIKYYYKKTSGGIDTLTTDPDYPTVAISAPLVGIYYEGGTISSFMSIAGLSKSTIENSIKDGLLYLEFPNGTTDSLRLNVRNKDGCNIESLNYLIDGLSYNGREADFEHKAAHNKIGMGTNRFKAYIH